MNGGDLMIIGDDLANQFRVESAGLHAYVITGLGDTLINGSASYTAYGVKDDITINTRGEADVVEIDVESIAGNLEIKTKDGRDTVRIANSVVRGSAYVNTGEGSDHVEILDNTFKRDLSISSTGERDTVSIGGSEVWRDLHIRTGAENDRVDVAGTYVARKLNIWTGGDSDEVYLAAVSAAYASIKTGDGQNVVNVGEGSYFGDLNICTGTDADRVTVDGVKVDRTLSVQTRDGTDDVTIVRTEAHSATIRTSSGNDRISICDSYFKDLEVKGGVDDDWIGIGNTTVYRVAYVGGGAGQDTWVKDDNFSANKLYKWGFEESLIDEALCDHDDSPSPAVAGAPVVEFSGTGDDKNCPRT